MFNSKDSLRDPCIAKADQMPSLAWTTALVTLAAIALYSDNAANTPTRETRSPKVRSTTCPNTAVGITANYDVWCKANCAMV